MITLTVYVLLVYDEGMGEGPPMYAVARGRYHSMREVQLGD